MKIVRDSLALLKNRSYASLMGAQWLAQAGDGLVGVALAKKITFGGEAGFNLDLEGAKTTEDALLIVLLTFLPYMFLSPFLGVLIDRWDRRRLLIGANGVRAVVLAVIGIVGPDTIGDAALYGSFLLILASTRLLLAIKGAGLPAALGERELVQGNSISQAGSAIFQLGGAGVALVASGFIDARWIVLVGAAVYLLGTLAAMGARRLGYPRSVVPLRQELRRMLADVAEAVREVGRRPMAALSLGSFLAIRALLTFVVLATVFISRAFIAEAGSLVSAVPAALGALGAAVGFVAAHALKDRAQPARIVTGALLLGGAGMVAFGGIINLLGISLLAMVVGLSFFLGKVAVDTMMQRALSDTFRGRGFSFQDIVYNLSWIIPAFILWLALDVDRARLLLMGGGVVFLLLGVLIGYVSGKIGALPEPEPEDAETA